MFENMRCSYEIIPEFMSAFGAGASVEVITRTEQVESVKANVFEMKFVVEDEQTRRMIEALYGKSFTSYAAPCKDGVAYAMGPNRISSHASEQDVVRKWWQADR